MISNDKLVSHPCSQLLSVCASVLNISSHHRLREGPLESRQRHNKRPSDVFWFVKNVYSMLRPKLLENESIWTLDFFFPGISTKYSFVFLQDSVLTHRMLWRRSEWQDRECSEFTASFGSHLVQPLNMDNTCASFSHSHFFLLTFCFRLSMTICLTSYHSLCHLLHRSH